MECRETQSLLTAFHDGELRDADRTRVEEHLRGCPECGALLADLARADRIAGVPDPGPEYWDRFNARVADRIPREADAAEVTVLRPKRGWMRQQLRYLVPAVAAAAPSRDRNLPLPRARRTYDSAKSPSANESCPPKV